MFRQRSLFLFKTVVALVVLALSGAVGYLIASAVIEGRNDRQLAAEKARLNDHGSTMADNINKLFGYYRGAAKAIAATPLIARSTVNKGQRSSLPPPHSRALDELNHYLVKVAQPLGVDLIWIMNEKGITVSSSNAQHHDTFVGRDFGFREYFKTAMQGRPSYQYAVGSVTNVPGLFFSEPIFQGEKIVGVAAVKINVTSIAKVLLDEDALLADRNGVVILARNPNYIMKQVPGASINSLPASVRESRYRQIDFPTLRFTEFSSRRHPAIQQVENHNVLHATFPIGIDEATVHLLREVHFIDSEDAEILALTLVLTAAGFMSTFALLFFLLNYMHERTFRAIFSNSAVGLVLLDENRRFLEFNQEFERYLGYSIDELEGLSVVDITYPEDRDIFPPVAALSGDDTPSYLEKRYVRRDGEIVWARVSVRQFLNWHRATRRLVVVEDITARKRVEEKLKQQEAQMITTAKMSALGEMAAGIAHEINNPLAIISGSAERLNLLLEGEALTPTKAQQISGKITSTVARIAKIISGLRSFARQGANDVLREVPVQAVIDDTLSFCQERLRHASIQLTIRIEPPTIAILCRPTEISQVLLNLLNNAHDALQGQTVREIEIGATIVGGMAELWVKDSGPGIPDDLRSKIMQPFFTTKEIGKGTGLGLSISSGIAEAHGGSLRLDEQSAQTRFIIRLPLANERTKTLAAS